MKVTSQILLFILFVVGLACSKDNTAVGNDGKGNAKLKINGNPVNFNRLNSYLIVEDQNKILISLSEDGNTSIGLETPIPSEFPWDYNLNSDVTAIAIWNDNGTSYTVTSRDSLVENLKIKLVGFLNGKINGSFSFIAKENGGNKTVNITDGVFTNVEKLN